jgi:hypothetical protein
VIATREITGSTGVALAAATLAVALVFAQDVVPAWAGYHTWQYSAALAIAAVAVLGYAFGARKGLEGDLGRRLTFAMTGALVIIAAGIASGLLGPDTETVARAPGTVAPLPDVGAAAFFPIAGPATIAAGDATIALRRRNASELEIGPGGRRFVGATVVELVPKPAVYVEARDPSGAHLTITQPTNPSFLSPVLLFPQEVPLANTVLPADAFATPAVHRQIKAFYFSKSASLAAKNHGLAGREAVLFAVDDDAGKLVPGGIGFAASGEGVDLGGVRLRPTVGTYPALVISAVPYPAALWLGGVLFFGGLGYGFLRRPAARTTANAPAATADV